MQSEKEFLSKYRIDEYERPSVTADIVALRIRSTQSDNYRLNSENKLTILLIKRGEHPYKDCWALPGGFLIPGETIEDCALRETKEETNVQPVSIMPIGVFSKPGRDPRGWIISNAYVSIISEDSVNQKGQDDAKDAQWFDVKFEQNENGEYNLCLNYEDNELKALLTEKEERFGITTFNVNYNEGFAFDHAEIIATALSMLRNDAKNIEIIFDFLPEKFTLSALQRVQETIMNISILPANFRRKISGFVTETDEYTIGLGHRPAKLYKRK